MEWMSTAQAAAVLGVSDQHVRRLVRSGALPAHRLGPAWLVSADGVRARARAENVPGRPLAPAVAWHVLRIVQAVIDAGGEQPTHAAERAAGAAAAAVAAVPDPQLRHRLRRRLVDSPPVERWPHWLRQRAAPHRVWVHPGTVHRLLADARVRSDPGAPSVIAARPVVYVEQALLDDVVAQYHARPSVDGPVRLMVIPHGVPDELIPPAGQPIPSALSMLESVQHPDARPRHLAIEFLNDARHAVRTALAT